MEFFDFEILLVFLTSEEDFPLFALRLVDDFEFKGLRLVGNFGLELE